MAYSRDREAILRALFEYPLKIYAIMVRANIGSEELCRQLLVEMRDDKLVNFDINTGRWSRA